MATLAQRLDALEAAAHTKHPAADPIREEIRRAVWAHMEFQRSGTPIPADIDPDLVELVREIDEEC